MASEFSEKTEEVHLLRSKKKTRLTSKNNWYE